MPLSSDIEACRALLRDGSRSFHAASLLLPARVRDPAVALYAFCRLADDAIDRDGGRLPAVGRLRERLDRCYAGRPIDQPADRAMADVVARFAIPHALPAALLEGLEWDAAGRRYETLSELLAYAARVAGAVGAMMALLMESRNAVAPACDLGVAMQLTNIARDVGEDARAGRLYLPRAWMVEAGMDVDAWLRDPRPSAALGGVVTRLLLTAESLYARGEAGIAHLPLSCRPGIFAARLLYAEIGHQVAARDFDSVSSRAVVSAGRKCGLVARAAGASLLARAGEVTAPLAETAYLVEAVRAAPRPLAARASARRGVRGSAVWVLDLFEQLERRDMLARQR